MSWLARDTGDAFDICFFCVCSRALCVVCHYLRTLRTVQKIRNHIVVHPEIVWESCDDEKATKRDIRTIKTSTNRSYGCEI